MTVRVDRGEKGFDADEPEVLVETTDATGTTREYLVVLTDDDYTFDDGRLLAGKRTDDDAPDEPAGGGPTQRAYQAARRAFESRGFDVHGGETDD